MRSFLVVGLGEFGKSVAKALYSNNATVLAIGVRENLIKQALSEGIVEEAIILDATGEVALGEVVHDNPDATFVSVDDSIQTNILITLQLKELGIKSITCRAVNRIQKRVLYKIGATQVIFPEESVGERIAYSVLRPTIIDYFKLAEDYFICEVKVPRAYVGESLMELNLRHKYEINISAVKHFDGEVDVAPDSDIKLNKNDLLMIPSREDVIGRVTKT